MALFATSGLCKFYRARTAAPVRALDDVSVTIPAGCFAVLAGPSGSGKTTLLTLLGALERPTRGQVLFDGRNLSDFSDVGLARVRRRFGFVFQDFSLIPGLPVWENLTYPLIPRGVGRLERIERARNILAELGLADKERSRPRELSGGEQQRVAVARALAGLPEVVFADEPTSNLDRKSAHTLIDLLQHVHRQGKTVICSSHDAEIISRATVVFELEAGKLKTVAS